MPKQTGKPGRPTTRPKNKKRLRAAVKIPGVEQPVWVSGYTRAEIDREKQRVRNEYIDGVKIKDITFHEAVIEWFSVVKRPKIKAVSTLKNWQNAINVHLLPYFSEKQLLRAVKREELQNCLDRLKGRNETTIVLTMAVMQKTFEYGASCGYVQLNPSMSLIKPESRETKEKMPLSLEQETAILNAASNSPYGLMIFLLYYLGLRRGEMLGLQWGDIDFKRKILSIKRDIDFNDRSKVGTVKTPAAERVVTIPDELMDMLLPLRGLPSGYVISKDGTHLKESGYKYRYNKIMISAGLAHVKDRYLKESEEKKKKGVKVSPPEPAEDYDVDITAHNFRHHYITAKVEAGERPEVLMALVGHRDYNTTIQTYTHINERLRNAEPTLLSAIFKKELDKKQSSCQ